MTAYDPLIVGGCQTYSKGRAAYPCNAPRYAEEAIGAYVWADDGRAYIDCVSALGAVILGHQYPDVELAVRDQLSRGVSFSLPTRLEAEVAHKLVDMMPEGDWQVRYAKNGADVTSAAVRIARAVTGRDHVLMYGKGYHGAQDWSMTRAPKNGGVPVLTRALTKFADCHDLSDIADALDLYRPACLVVEPVVNADPELPPAGYFRRLRELCDRTGALLVIDEMVTGFRLGLPGAITAFGIEPDLACYGKGIANGYPLSVLVGRRGHMRHIEDDVFVSSTFGGEAVGLAAASACLDVLRREDVPAALARAGDRLGMEYSAVAASHGLDTRLIGYSARPVMHWSDAEQRRVFLEALADMGVLNAGYFNLTLEMSRPETLDRLLAAIRRSFGVVQSRARRAA